jgi:hypothetical protein
MKKKFGSEPLASRARTGEWIVGSALSWAVREWRKGEESEGLAGPVLASSWVSAHCQIGVRNFFSFSNLFIICKLI